MALWNITHATSLSRQVASGRDSFWPVDIPSSHSNTSCPLNAPGTFDPEGNFFLDDLSCPWVDYAGNNVLAKTTDLALTDEQLVGYSSNVLHNQQRLRSILLIGDSQDRNTVEFFCGGTISGANLTVVLPRWSTPDGKIHSAPRPQQGNRNLHFRTCRVGQLMIASFFHFGFTPVEKIMDGHSSEGEPLDVFERIDNILPKYIEDVFGKDVGIDIVVINSGLWDLFSGIFRSNDPGTLIQNVSQWHTRANRVANSLEALIPTSSIIWRNLPDVRNRVTNQSFTTYQEEVKLINEMGVSFAESRNWPVLDLRGSLSPLGVSVLQDEIHLNHIGQKFYLNRILNALGDQRLLE